MTLARLLAPGQGLVARAASWKDLRSGVPSNPSGRSSGRTPRPVPSSNPANSTPNISCVSRSCQAAPANTSVTEANGSPSATRVVRSSPRSAPGVAMS